MEQEHAGLSMQCSGETSLMMTLVLDSKVKSYKTPQEHVYTIHPTHAERRDYSLRFFIQVKATRNMPLGIYVLHDS